MEGGSVSTNKMVVRGLAGASAAGKPGTSDGRAKVEVAWGPGDLAE